MNQMQLERLVKVKDTVIARQNKLIEKLSDRSLLFNERVLESLSSIEFGKQFKSLKSKTNKVGKRYVNILLSDLHFGANLDGRESPLPYGPTEERRRLAAIAKEVIDYKTHYRDHTGLVVHLAGDIIQGRLHDPADAAPVSEQVTRALYLLGAFLGRMVEAYPTVEVYCTPGNHGRIKDRHPERSVNQKWDSFENIIYEGLRLMFQSNPKITFSIPKTPFYEYTLFGMKGFVTHGDTVVNPGNPGKAVNVGRLEQQILKLTAARGDYRLVAVGHVHVPSVVHLPSTVLITNGCLVPPDPYAMSIGLHSNATVQQLWETVPNYMFGDHRMLNISSVTDSDSSLDEVIPSASI